MNKETKEEPVSCNQPGKYIIQTIGIILIIGYFLSALTPPVSYDVLEYHLAAPKEMIRQHSFAIFPHIFYTHMPLNMEMLYAVGMMLENAVDPLSPKLLTFGFLLLNVAIISYWLSRSGLSNIWVSLGTIMFLSHPIVLRSAVDAMNDLAVCLWITLALITLVHWMQGHDKSLNLLFIGGLLVGLAIGAKYTAIFLYMLPMLIVLLPAGLRERRQYNPESGRLYPIISTYTIFIGGVVFAFLPWMIKNTIINHNPLFPSLSFLFPSPAWTPVQEHFYIASSGQVHPLQLLFWKNVLQRIYVPGIIYLLPSLLVLFIPTKEIKIQGIKSLTLCMILSYIIWNLWSTSADRFIIALIPVMILATVQVFWWIQHQGHSGKLLAGALFIVVAAKTIPVLFNFVLMDVVRYGTCIHLRDEYRKEYLGDFADALLFARESIPAPAKILLIYEARPYYFDQPVIANSVFDQSPLLTLLDTMYREQSSKSLSVKDLIDELRAQGVTHILVNELELIRLVDFYTPEEYKASIRSFDMLYTVYPAWLNDQRFVKYRALIGEFLRLIKEHASYTTNREKPGITITPLENF